MEKGDGHDGRGNVVCFEDYRQRRRSTTRPAPPAPLAEAIFDEATRDLHAAASTTLKLVYLVRSQLGLPEL